MVPGDLGRVAELEQQLFGLEAWNRESLAEELRAPNRWYQVAESVAPSGAGPGLGGLARAAPGVASSLVGYAGLWFAPDVTQVMTIGVAPEAQRRGIGAALLGVLIDKSILLGSEAMFLEVAVENSAALALYRGAGFYPIGIRKRYYGNRDAFSMRLDLGE